MKTTHQYGPRQRLGLTPCALLLALAAAAASALEPVTEQDAQRAATQWLKTRAARHGEWGGAGTPEATGVRVVSNRRGTILGYVATVAPSGYILTSPVRELPPVKAYSATDTFDEQRRSDPQSPEALILAAMERALDSLQTAEDADAVPAGAEANREAWQELLGSSSRAAYSDVPGLQFAMRPPLFLADKTAFSGAYDKPLAWSQLYPYNKMVPAVRAVPEEIWLEGDPLDDPSHGVFSPPDFLLYDASPPWSTQLNDIGSTSGLYYYDADQSGDYTNTVDDLAGVVLTGENIWKDEAGGNDGVYDEGIDLHIFPAAGMPGWVTPDAATGSQAGLYYNDIDLSGDYTYVTAHPRPDSFTVGLASVLRYWEWPDVGTGSHSYEWAYHEQGKDEDVVVQLTANYDRAYPWARMPLNMLGLYTPSEQDNVAQLIFDVGVALEVDFQLDGPLLHLSQDAADRVAHHFRYNQRAIEYLQRGNVATDDEWFDKVKTELDAQRPVVLRTFNAADETLSAAIDGYVRATDATNMSLLHWNVGGGRFWYALDNLGGVPYGSPSDAFDVVMSQDAFLNILPRRARSIALVELFRDTGDAAGQTLSNAVQTLQNSYGTRLVVLAYHPTELDTYYPADRPSAVAQTSDRFVTRYGATTQPPTAVVQGDASTAVDGSGDAVTDLIAVNAEIERRLATPATYRIVGECVLGVTPDPDGRPVFKSDVYVSRLDQETPESETVTCRLVLAENVDGGPNWVVREFLDQKELELGYGETRVVHTPDFPLPPDAAWDLSRCQVIAFVERADGSIVQASSLDRYEPGPNYEMVDGLALYRPLLINSPPEAPSEVVLTQSADGISMRADVIGANDPDGDAVYYVFDWYRNGVQNYQQTTADPIMSLAGIDVGTIWHCEVRVRDVNYYNAAAVMKESNHESAATLSNALLVTKGQAPAANSAPSSPVFASLSPDQPTAGGEITCLTGGATDADGDIVTYLFTWSLDGVPTAYSTPTLPFGVAQEGEQWTCQVRVRDIWGAESDALATAAATIAEPAAGAPTRPAYVAAGPEEPSYISTLRSSEPTGIRCPDAFVVNYRWWKRVGASWRPTAETTSAVALSPADIGSQWRCAVSATNTVTGAMGPSLFTNAVLVRNFAPTAPSVAVAPQYAKISDELRCFASASVDKEDGQEIGYYYAWYVDGEFSGIAGVGRNTVAADYVSSGEEWTCRVYTVDSQGARSADVASANSAHIGGPPTPPKRAPLEPPRPEDYHTVTCSASGSEDPDGDTVIYLYKWYKEEPLPPGAEAPRIDWLPPNRAGYYWKEAYSGNILPSGLTTYADRWCCEIRASDGTAASAPIGTEAITIGNQSPSRPTLAIRPEDVVPGDALECAITGEAHDPEDDGVTYTYRWYKVGQYEMAYAGKTLPAGTTELSDTWYCEVTATDDWNPAASVVATSPYVAFRAVPPSAPEEVYIAPAFPRTTHDLVCVATGASDPNNDVVAYEFQWYLNGAVSAGHTGSTVLAADTADGQVWSCTVTVRDGTGLTSDPVNVPGVTVGNRPPTIPRVGILPNPAGVGVDLVCSAGGAVDPNGDPVAYLYQWYRNSAPANGETDYRIGRSLLVLGDTWSCEARATDGELLGEALMTDVLTISDLAPDGPLSVAIHPGQPTEIDNLICLATGSLDPEGGVVSYRYQWYRNGIATDFTEQLVDAANTAIGEEWHCEVRSVDLSGSTSPAVSSEPVTVVSPAPSTPSVSLGPPVPTVSDELVCEASGSTDPRGGTVTYVYTWYRDGNDAGFNGRTVSPAVTTAGEIWKCAVYTENDVGLRSATVTTNEVYVENHAPTAPSVSVQPEAPQIGDTLTCYASGAVDPDGNELTYEYEWLKNGAPAGVTDRHVVLSVENTDNDDTWECRARAVDAYGATGAYAVSDSVQVGNQAPSQPTSVVVTPGVAEIGGSLACQASGSEDPNGDAVTYLFRWQTDEGSDGATWADVGKAGDTVTGLTDDGWQWRCLVRATDGTLNSAETASNVATVLGHAPTAPTTVIVTPANPSVRDDLVCAATGSTDPDAGDENLVYVYEWFRNGLPAGLSGDTVSAGQTAEGEVWTCSVYARDPRGAASDAATSEAVLVTQRPPSTPASVTLTPLQPTLNNQLVCAASGAQDPDGGAVAYTFAWYRNGTLEPDYDGNVLPAAATKVADVWTCAVSARDSEGAMSEAVVSNDVTIRPAGNDEFETDNTRDTASGIADGERQVHVINPGTDVDWVTFSVDELSEVRLTAEVLVGSTSVSVVVYADDGEIAVAGTGGIDHILSAGSYAARLSSVGSGIISAYAVTLAAMPARALGTATALSLNQSRPSDRDWAYMILTEATAVTLTATVVEGAGTVPLALYDATFSVLAQGTAGELFTDLPAGLYYVSVDGGTTPGTRLVTLALASAVSVTANEPPSAPTQAWIIPEDPLENTELTAVAGGASDPDGDALTYVYHWFRNGERVSAYTGVTVDAAAVTSGDTWQCEVVAADGFGAGSTGLLSNTVSVGARAGWELAIDAGGASNSLLVIGQDSAATNNWDTGLDDVGAPAAPGTPHVVLLGPADHPQLSRDIRSLKGALQFWYVDVSLPAGFQGAATLSWDQGDLPERVGLTVAELDASGDVVAGPAGPAGPREFDMSVVNNLDLTAAAANPARYRISCIREELQYETLGLGLGWNLVSVSLRRDDDSASAVFGGAVDGSVWRYDAEAGTYLAAAQLSPKVGYWVFVPAATTVRHIGLPETDGDTPLRSGWNLVGPVADTAIPADPVLAGPVWGYENGMYRAAALLKTGKGYWIFAGRNTIVNLR